MGTDDLTVDELHEEVRILRWAIFALSRSELEMRRTLTAAQARGTELLGEARLLRALLDQATHSDPSRPE